MKLLTIHGQHHPKLDIDRLCFSRKQGGRGFMQLEAAHAVEVTKLLGYVDRKEYLLMQVVRTHQHNTDSTVLVAGRSLNTEVQKETRKMKDNIAEKNNRKVALEEDAWTIATWIRWWIMNSHIAG